MVKYWTEGKPIECRHHDQRGNRRDRSPPIIATAIAPQNTEVASGMNARMAAKAVSDLSPWMLRVPGSAVPSWHTGVREPLAQR
jgi:hypothetical protein